jgi:plastocyanin
MRSRLLLGVVGAATLLLGMAVPVVSASAGRTNATFSVGVGAASPAGHNFDYMDFFPRANVSVHRGDVVGFQWANDPDGFHTATVLKDGESPPDAWNSNPLFVPDTDDPNGQLQANPAVFGPSNPACGNTDTNACQYDGTSDLNSGANATDGQAGYFVQFNVAAGTTVNYVCLIHPGMAATVNVVDDQTPASTQSDLDTAATAQAQDDTAGALAAEKAASDTSTTTNPDGTKTVTMTAGTSTPRVQVLEFLPMNVQVDAGDTVKYAAKGTDPHTVTFPMGTSEGEPLVPMCEGDPDTAADPTQNPPCGDPTLFEQHLYPAPSGATSIDTPTTFGTSGIIGIPHAPSDYSYTFPSAGTFQYICHIHDHMIGTVTVAAVSTPATPVEAQPNLTG